MTFETRAGEQLGNSGPVVSGIPVLDLSYSSPLSTQWIWISIGSPGLLWHGSGHEPSLEVQKLMAPWEQSLGGMGFTVRQKANHIHDRKDKRAQLITGSYSCHKK